MRRDMLDTAAHHINMASGVIHQMLGVWLDGRNPSQATQLHAETHLRIAAQALGFDLVERNSDTRAVHEQAVKELEATGHRRIA